MRKLIGFDNSKKIKEIEKRLANLEKQDLPGEIKSLRKEFDEEIRSINKQLGPLYDKDAEAEKHIAKIEKINEDIVSVLSGLKESLTNLNKRLIAVESVWNAETLKKINKDIESFSDSIEELSKMSKDVFKKLEKTNSGIMAIARHASDIEEEHLDAKFAADELAKRSKNLAETLDYFSSQTDAINSKLSANAAALSDLTSNIEILKQRLEAIENKTPLISQISALLNEQTATINQLANRLAYLEKETVKTVVID